MCSTVNMKSYSGLHTLKMISSVLSYLLLIISLGSEGLAQGHTTSWQNGNQSQDC